MWNWLMDHLATILISLALLAVVVLIVRHLSLIHISEPTRPY